MSNSDSETDIDLSDAISLGDDEMVVVADSEDSDTTEPLPKSQSPKPESNDGEGDPKGDPCIICQEDIQNPIKLECNHTFCFSCIKGSMIKSGTDCPLCRKALSKDYKHMIFKAPEKLCQKILVSLDSQWTWIYSGKNCGWWYFEPKASEELENLYDLYTKGQLTANSNQVTICGYVYRFDFSSMEQINTQNGAIRHIQRLSVNDLTEFKKSNQIKGICGIKVKDI